MLISSRGQMYYSSCRHNYGYHVACVAIRWLVQLDSSKSQKDIHMILNVFVCTQ
jgi:hypothetical protein